MVTGAGSKKEQEMAAANERQEIKEAATSRTATNVGEGEGRVSVSVHECLRDVSERIRALENKLEIALGKIVVNEKEMCEGRESIRQCRITIEEQKEEIEKLKAINYVNRNRIGELEVRLDAAVENRENETDTMLDENENEKRGRGGKERSVVNRETDGTSETQSEENREEVGGSQQQGREGNTGNSEIKDRAYLASIPSALSEGEYECEMAERKNRKKNLMIRGIRTVGKGLKEEVKNTIKKFMGIEIYIGKVRPLGGGLLVELESFENKLEILKRKSMLKGIGLWVEEDLTEREKQVQE